MIVPGTGVGPGDGDDDGVGSAKPDEGIRKTHNNQITQYMIYLFIKDPHGVGTANFLLNRSGYRWISVPIISIKQTGIPKDFGREKSKQR